MAKPLKIVLIVAGVIVALFVLLALAASMLFDPNDHRGEIAAQVKKSTGRDFSAGAIQLHVFPWLAVELHDVTLGNAPGFGAEPMLRLADARAGVRLMPLLFDRRVSVNTVTVHGLALNLAKDRNGKDNWSDIGEHNKDQAPSPDQGKGQVNISDLRISGVDIKDASLTYADAQAGKNYQLQHVNLSTGALKPGAPFDFKLALTAASAAPQMQADIKLASTLAADIKEQQYKLSDLKLEIEASGAGVPGGKQQLGLTGAASYDGKAGALKIPAAQISALGMAITADITGEGLLGETPKLSGPLRIAPFSPRKVLNQLGKKMEPADPDALKQMSLAADYRGSFKSATLDNLTLKLDQTTATGRIELRDFATQAIEFALKVDRLDAGRYGSPKGKEAKQEAAQGDEKALNQTEVPLDLLTDLNAQGTLDVEELKVSGLTLTGARVKLGGARGQTKNVDVESRLYGGAVAMHTRVSPGARPQVATTTKLTALNTAPFLKDLTGKDLLSGVGSFDLDLAGSGKTVGDLRKSLAGSVSLKLENGAVKGFNLAEILRRGQAMLAGNAAPRESAPQQTDFAAISASGKILNGVLESNDLAGASPAFRLAGAGKIDLANETINYLVKPTIVETSTGEGGKSLDQLRGITVPIQLSGNLLSPKYQLDLQAALQQKAMSRVNEKIEANKGKLQEKLNEGLNRLFGNKPQQQPPPAPAPATAPAAPPKT